MGWVSSDTMIHFPVVAYPSSDYANRLVNVGGVNYTWDNNGNLLSGAGYTYTYDSANRLVKLQQGATLTYTLAYNGQGDRVSLAVNGVPTTYTLDLNAGLVQILVEGSTTYLYGTGRIAQQSGTTSYFLGDGLGSVRQLTDGAGRLALTRWYDPYGNIVSNRGDATTMYGFTGEWGATLIDLRARWYAPAYGRFITRDPVMGQYTQPQTLNPYAYGLNNPILYTDPSGRCIFTGVDTVACLIALAIGIPIVAGVVTSAWDYAVTQGGGVGGFNQNNRECIDMRQVLEAGKGGSLGALSSEGQMLASIPLGPTYLMAYLAYGATPDQVNMDFLSAFGLDDEYRAALRNPYYFAGQSGGNAGMAYISLASFVKGLPTFIFKSTPVYGPLLQPGGTLASRLVLTLPGIEVIGGSGELVYVGTAGMASQFSMMSGGGGGGGTSPHKGFIDNLRRMSHSSLRKTIISLQNNIEEHLAKIRANPDSLAVHHWQTEIENWQEELELAIQEAEQRGFR